MHILSPETDNCPSWISGRERMTVENISWSISTKECCRPRWGLNPRPPGLQSDGASNWATEARIYVLFSLRMAVLLHKWEFKNTEVEFLKASEKIWSPGLPDIGARKSWDFLILTVSASTVYKQTQVPHKLNTKPFQLYSVWEWFIGVYTLIKYTKMKFVHIMYNVHLIRAQLFKTNDVVS